MNLVNLYLDPILVYYNNYLDDNYIFLTDFQKPHKTKKPSIS